MSKTDLPIVDVMANLHNPKFKEWVENGRIGKEPDYYVKKLVSAQVLIWNINAGSIRCRILSEDKTMSPYEGPDKPLREKYKLIETGE